MAAILRSGKFLRYVSGLNRFRNDDKDHVVQGSNPSNSPLIACANNIGSIKQHHSLSLQSLCKDLPVLSADQDQISLHKDSKLNLLERRGSDPLLEFYVDKQKLEEAAKNVNILRDKSPVGLNLVNELTSDTDKSTFCEPVKTIQKSASEKIIISHETKSETSNLIECIVQDKQPIKEVVVQSTHETNNVATTNEITNECTIHETDEASITSSAELEPIIEEDVVTAETQVDEFGVQAAAVPLVPLCQDPVSHEWYPLPVVCQMFRSQGRMYDLEALLWGSQGIRPEDRKCIYFWTLQTYADFGMFPQAVDLTRRLETEGLGLEFPEYHSMMNNFAMAVYSQQKRKALSSIDF